MFGIRIISFLICAFYIHPNTVFAFIAANNKLVATGGNPRTFGQRCICIWRAVRRKTYAIGNEAPLYPINTCTVHTEFVGANQIALFIIYFSGELGFFPFAGFSIFIARGVIGDHAAKGLVGCFVSAIGAKTNP